MKACSILFLIVFFAVGCSGVNINVSFGATPTPTSTVTATVTSTSTPDLGATATAQARATSTAQAQASLTAQAAASMTAQAQSTASARAALTTVAQSTVSAAATKSAMVAYAEALAQKAGSPYVITQEKLQDRNRWFDTRLELKNFVAQAEFFNPADPNIHPWDYGFVFRIGGFTDQRIGFCLRSNGTWSLSYPIKALADAVEVKRQTGTVPQMNLSPTGSNRVRLVVNEKDAFLFVNGEYVAMMDLSDRVMSGAFYIVTGLIVGDDFPGLSVTIKNVSIAGLP